ncbi:MAG: phosphoribosyltransferase family protein [Patescibacteria group bacterium]
MFSEPISKLMDNTKPKILKEKSKDDEEVIPMVWRLRKLGFLPKFLVLDIQATSFYKRLILRWVLNFFKKILSFPQKVFFLAFTETDTKLQNLEKLPSISWQNLAHPILHSDNTLSIFNYDNKMVRGALFYIKNKKSEGILTEMCQITIDILLEDLADQEMLENFIDPILVSIPSSKGHVLKRGYNPSDLIASKISELSSIPYSKNIIYKSKNTPAQKTLSRYERLKNVRNSMTINPKDQLKIKDKCIIVIDDIMTTGATLKEAKRILLKSGARKVIGVVLAH